ncbi:hypothetical protein Patl1_15818 [Pistacia atlantica]|uniref:Uncharacterized protein n=1 Tax=Pistacia atlantica TaxID=434234 RepID=A0ACC1B7W1_9ROSI|nr:hypothetical protein Patl1_15818 [Pistacia atlantica]
MCLGGICRWKIVFVGGRWFAGGRLDNVRWFCVVGIERKMVSHVD